jgi:hypothetical protein
MKHKIEVATWKYQHLDRSKNPTLFVEDAAKGKYNLMDIVEISTAPHATTQSRLIISILYGDEAIKDGFVMLTLGEKADFENGCLVTAVFKSVGKL